MIEYVNKRRVSNSRKRGANAPRQACIQYCCRCRRSSTSRYFYHFCLQLAADAIMEAADAGIKVIITITEGIPVADMVKASNYIKGRDCTLIGPNCPE